MYAKHLIAFAVLLLSLPLAGCAGDEQFREGQRLMAQGDSDRAVLAFRQAAEASPNNARYQINLDDAESTAADQHVAQAEKFLADGQPSEARTELQTALGFMPAHPKAVVMMGRIDANVLAAADSSEEPPQPVEKPAPARPATRPAAIAKVDEPTPAPAVQSPPKPQEPATRPSAIAKVDEPTPAPAVQSPSKPQEPSSRPAVIAKVDEPVPAPTVQSSPKPQKPASRPAIIAKVDEPTPTPAVRSSPKPQKPASRPAQAALTKLPTPAPAPPAADGSVQAASASPAAPAPAPPLPPDHTFTGMVSRDSKRFPPEREAIDGIVVKLKNTSKNPLRADLEVRVGKLKKKYDDLRIGARIRGRGQSRQQYDLVILSINDATETVGFALDPLPPRGTSVPPRGAD